MSLQDIPSNESMLQDLEVLGIHSLLTNETNGMAKRGETLGAHTRPLRVNIISLIIPSLGILMNSLVALVTWKNKSLRNSTFICLTSLAFADILFLAVSMVVFTRTTFHEEISKNVMTFIACLQDCGRLCSAFHLVLLSAIRFYMLGFPFKALVNLTCKRTMIFCGLTWVLSVVVATINVLVMKMCWYGHPQNSIPYHYDAIIVYYFVPLTMLTIFHLLKLEWVNRSRRQWGTSDKRNRRMLLMVICVILLFAVLNLPITVRSFLMIHKRRINLLGEIASYCLLLNSALNPILYWVFSPQFRSGLVKTFCCVFPRKDRAFERRAVNSLVINSFTTSVSVNTEQSDFEWNKQ